MAVFKIRQKLLSLKEDYYIKDEKDNICYQIDSNLDIIREKFTLSDANGRPIYYFKEKYLRLRPTFYIFNNKQESNDKNNSIGIMRRKGFFLANFIMNFNNGASYECKGRFGLPYTFIITKEGKEVGSIHKKLLKIIDTYEVESYEDSESANVVAFAIAIDQISHSGDRNNRNMGMFS